MRSSFAALDVAYRALQAHQQAVDVTNHNIANANTPGYSRQNADFVVTPPYSAPSLSGSRTVGQIGTGVAVAAINRSRNSFVDYQIRSETQTLGQWSKTRDALQQVELVFNEPSDSGLNYLLSKFWQAWHDLANAPHDAGARRALLEQADSLATTFNRKQAQLTSIQRDMDDQLRVTADRVNQLADQIATLNVQIAEVELTGQHANDLRDRRDLVLDELSHLTRVTYYESPQGGINVFVGSRALVFGPRAERLSIVIDSSRFANIVWETDGSMPSIIDGELYGMQQARDVELPRFIGDLQALAGQLISSVNSLHSGGYGLDNSTGFDFFTGSGPGDIAVNPALKSRPEKMAAGGSSDAPGDGSIALSVAALQRSLTMDGGTNDFGKFLASIVSRLGVGVQRAEMMADNQQLLVDYLGRQRQSLSGVSLDEEATRLIEYQRAYQAAARVVNAIDEMLDTLINGMGRVGR